MFLEVWFFRIWLILKSKYLRLERACVDSIYGFQSNIVVVWSLFPRSFLREIEAIFFHPFCINSVSDRQIQTYQQLRYLGRQWLYKALVPFCCQRAGTEKMKLMTSQVTCINQCLSTGDWWLFIRLVGLTLYTLTSVCIFSILFSIDSLRCWQGEFAFTFKRFFSWWSFPFSFWP